MRHDRRNYHRHRTMSHRVQTTLLISLTSDCVEMSMHVGFPHKLAHEPCTEDRVCILSDCKYDFCCLRCVVPRDSCFPLSFVAISAALCARCIAPPLLSPRTQPNRISKVSRHRSTHMLSHPPLPPATATESDRGRGSSRMQIGPRQPPSRISNRITQCTRTRIHDRMRIEGEQ